MRRKIDVSRTASLSGADVVNERGPQLIHNQFWGTTFHGQDTVYSVFDVRDTRRLHAHDREITCANARVTPQTRKRGGV
jgi:hypothetical protein